MSNRAVLSFPTVGIALMFLLIAITLWIGRISETNRLTAADPLSSDVDTLIERLHEPSANDRAAAARLLGEMGKQAVPAIPALVALLADDSVISDGGSVANVARAALVGIGEPAARACVSALIKEPARADAKLLWRTIADFHDEEAIKTLIALTKDTNPKVRHTAVAALNESTDPGLVPGLVDRFKDGDFRVQYTAITHFRKHRDERTVQPLIDALADDHESIRREAARALGVQGDRRAVRDLLARMDDREEDGGTRSAAAEALGKIGGPEVFESLMAIVENGRGYQGGRFGAVQGLGHLGDNRASALLRAMVHDVAEDSSVRIACAKSLVQLEGKDVYPAITDVVTNAGEEPIARFWMAVDLVEVTGGVIHDTRVVDAIHCYRHEKYPILRKEAEDAARKAFARVASAGSSSEVRSAAQARLGQLTSESK